MFQKCQERSRLLFANEYEKTLAKLRSELGSIIVEYYAKNTLTSSPGHNAIWRIATPAARHLSEKRLELDLDSLNKFGLSVQENTKWLRENQNKLLLEDFWKQFVLTEYKRPVFKGRTAFGENSILEELKNILRQVENEIDAKELEPIHVQQPPIATNNFTFNGGQNNLALNHSTQTINYGTDIQEIIIKFVELLKESNLPEEFKEETINLAKHVAEESKVGQPSESIRKSLCEKLLLLKDPAVTINATMSALSGLYNIGNYLYQLYK